jgi:LysR family transcriptional regulator, glycine cleavage system transcriptional activator
VQNTNIFECLPPFDGVVAAIAAYDTGSFSAAAMQLGLTHGSISRRIGMLEHWLGSPLFERKARGVAPTPAGQRFLSEARQAVALLAKGNEQWRPRRGRALVRLSVVPSLARLVIIPNLAELQGGNLSIELVVEHRPSDIDAREADIAIRYGVGQYEDVAAELVARETLVPCATPEIAQQVSASENPNSLLAFPLLHDSNPDHWRVWLGQNGILYRPRSQDRRFEDYDLVLHAAAAGLGIAMLRLPTAQDWERSGKIVRLSQEAVANPAGHYLVTRSAEERPHVIAAAERLRKLMKSLSA